MLLLMKPPEQSSANALEVTARVDVTTATTYAATRSTPVQRAVTLKHPGMQLLGQEATPSSRSASPARTERGRCRQVPLELRSPRTTRLIAGALRGGGEH